MSKLRAKAARLASRLLENFVLQVVIAAVPLAIGAPLGLLVAAQSHPLWAIAVLSGGWTGSGLGVVLWLSNHRAARERRTRAMGRLMFVSDNLAYWWATKAKRSSEGERKEQIRATVTGLLSQMCQILAYRLDISAKAATFLVVTHVGDENRLRLFASFNHDDLSIREEVSGLPTGRGLAAQAMRTYRCVALEDCENNPPDSGIDWVKVHEVERFRGRACSPVRIYSDQKWIDIGAICFDTHDPWLLQREDQQVMDMFGDKIASLWRMYRQ